MSSPEEIAERLERATADAREVLSELHSTLKASNKAHRELLADITNAGKVLQGAVREEYGHLVHEGLKEYEQAVKAAASKAYDDVSDNVERLANLAMYGNEQGRGPTIFDQIRAKLEGEPLAPFQGKAKKMNRQVKGGS